LESWWWKEQGKTEEALSLIELYEENPENKGAKPIVFIELRKNPLEKSYKQSVLENLYIYFPKDEESHIAIYGDVFYAQEMTKIAEYTEGIQSSENMDARLHETDEKTTIISETFEAQEDLTESYKISGDRVYYKGKRIYISGDTDDFEILLDNETYDAKDTEFYYRKGQRKTCKDPKAGYANYTYCNINGEIYFDDTHIENADEAINILKPGITIGDISSRIQTTIEGGGYAVVREMTGHGIGRTVHEKPEICNYGTPGTGPKIAAGQTFAIEPIATMGGSGKLYTDNKDKWTAYSNEGALGGHFEFTVVITDNGCEILTPWHEEILDV